jgi:hypothetical protein
MNDLASWVNGMLLVVTRLDGLVLTTVERGAVRVRVAWQGYENAAGIIFYRLVP